MRYPNAVTLDHTHKLADKIVVVQSYQRGKLLYRCSTPRIPLEHLRITSVLVALSDFEQYVVPYLIK